MSDPVLLARAGRLRALKRAGGAAAIAARGAYGTTALMEAARRGHEEVVRWLVAEGAPLDAVDRKGESALHKAAFSGSWETYCALREAGADDTLRSKRGMSPADFWPAGTRTEKAAPQSFASALQRLPPEIMFLIAEHLAARDACAFAMTCRRAAAVVGPGSGAARFDALRALRAKKEDVPAIARASETDEVILVHASARRALVVGQRGGLHAGLYVDPANPHMRWRIKNGKPVLCRAQKQPDGIALLTELGVSRSGEIERDPMRKQVWIPVPMHAWWAADKAPVGRWRWTKTTTDAGTGSHEAIEIHLEPSLGVRVIETLTGIGIPDGHFGTMISILDEPTVAIGVWDGQPQRARIAMTKIPEPLPYRPHALVPRELVVSVAGDGARSRLEIELLGKNVVFARVGAC